RAKKGSRAPPAAPTEPSWTRSSRTRTRTPATSDRRIHRSPPQPHPGCGGEPVGERGRRERPARFRRSLSAAGHLEHGGAEAERLEEAAGAGVGEAGAEHDARGAEVFEARDAAPDETLGGAGAACLFLHPDGVELAVRFEEAHPVAAFDAAVGVADDAPALLEDVDDGLSLARELFGEPPAVPLLELVADEVALRIQLVMEAHELGGEDGDRVEVALFAGADGEGAHARAPGSLSSRTAA